MKKLLLVLGVVVGAGLAPTLSQAQTTPTPDTTRTQQAKPQLNTAPPGAPARQAPAPTPAPARGYEVTTPAPTPAPATPAPQPGVPADQPGAPVYRPNPNSPSGLEFPPGSRASEQPKPLRRYFVYSNFGLGYSSFYGDGQFNIGVAPAIGYRVSERFAIGPGISYSYISANYSALTQSVNGYPAKIHYHNVGVKGFAQFIVYKQFFLHGEYEVTQLNATATDSNGRISKGHQVANTLLGGAGYRTQLGDRFAADIVILYNFNDGLDSGGYRNSPYGQPEIRFNFLFDIGK
ncbi:hypothetical protein [Hymenobacter defluvii]|uniref:Outer membrane beta-barrel protein n=1 Tax=Hymenobacter defluvii TaxID=2054411 RepID=A0ABS3T7L1_9BACT|nr:hypothetical protein [Hymenobacter defluvii]MBO3269626.1 hypothetical protein [Hymenobacter defluvii]